MPDSSSGGLLEGQIAIVTGGSSGIGAACALALGRAGAKVIVNHTARGIDRGKAVAAEIEQAGGRALAFEADVSREADIDAMFARTVERFGTVDILIANAGIQRDAAFADMSLADWQGVVDVNLTGQFLCVRAAVREFLRRGPRPEVSAALGKIVCMSSVHQVIPWAGHVNYAVTKAGIGMLVQSVAQELAWKKVRINGVAPGAIRTPINQSVWQDPASAGELMKLIPYRRIGDPDDVAKAVVWLASDQSDYVNGTTLFVDGGMVLYPGFVGNG
jgi:glucose 1-dehydrogenase